MNDIKIIDTNPENIYDFALCGYKNPKNAGYISKAEWLKNQFQYGLKYKVLYSEARGTLGSIEYIPAEHAWRPVNADGYMFIHCIMIMPKDHKGKGYGSLMIDECIKDAELLGMKGVAVVCRDGTWMSGKEIYLQKGFTVADKAKPDFELLIRKFQPESATPSFSGAVQGISDEYRNGMFIFTSAQCPYTEKAVSEISETANLEYNINTNIIEMHESKDVAKCPSAFGTFSIIFNGKIIADHPISRTRFKNILNNIKV
jgi:hypothetical protein